MEIIYMGDIHVGGILVRVIIMGVIKVVGCIAKRYVNMFVIVMGSIKV